MEYRIPYAVRSRVKRALLAAFLFAVCASAQEIQHLRGIHSGGFPGLPTMTGIEAITNGVRITWDGPSGYYQLYQKSNVTSSSWKTVGTPNINRIATVTNVHGNAFFKVLGPAPYYAGAQACQSCHPNIYNLWSRTPHAQAFDKLVQAGLENDPSYLPSYTVGYGLPTGYKTNTHPANLKHVQCENCHGSAARHAANELDLSVRPRVELAGEVCGGCHSGAKHPTFEEWRSTPHHTVVEDQTDSVSSCGRCHSGSARLALIKGQNPAITVTNDANVGITCAVCHDPHQTHVWTNVMTGIIYTNQLRQILSSTNDFFLTTSDDFLSKYNPNINICAQCHNHRGASWTSTSRPPHHSPQYNILLGTVGQLPAGVTTGPATHAGTKFAGPYLVTNQCVTCHVEKHDYLPGLPPLNASTGHKFSLNTYNACTDCHGSAENGRDFAEFLAGIVEDQIQQIKSDLDTWALTKAPPALSATYGTRAWEYTNPGDLSPGGPGPNSSEQAQIPDNIKKARFNLYLVLYDGSGGTHNGPHCLKLLDAAQDWVNQELSR